jgi:hypothetical protein
LDRAQASGVTALEIPLCLRPFQGSAPFTAQGWRCRWASEAAEKGFLAVILSPSPVILSEAKDLALSVFKTMRDPSSPSAPQDDSLKEFFRSLLSLACHPKGWRYLCKPI